MSSHNATPVPNTTTKKRVHHTMNENASPATDDHYVNLSELSGLSHYQVFADPDFSWTPKKKQAHWWIVNGWPRLVDGCRSSADSVYTQDSERNRQCKEIKREASIERNKRYRAHEFEQDQEDIREFERTGTREQRREWVKQGWLQHDPEALALRTAFKYRFYWYEGILRDLNVRYLTVPRNFRENKSKTFEKMWLQMRQRSRRHSH